MTPAAARDLIDMLHGSPMSVLSDSLRGFLISKPGHDLISCDFNAIEARVLAWLAGEESVLQIFKTSGKIYEFAAGGIYNVDPKTIGKDDPRRQVGKVAILALGYQGGVGALQQMARAYGVKFAPLIDGLIRSSPRERVEKAEWLYNKAKEDKKTELSQAEYIASDLVKLAWREANPFIVQYWSGLEFGAQQAVKSPGIKFAVGPAGRQVTYLMNGSWLFCRLPSGRCLAYPYPEIKKQKSDWGEKEGLTYKSEDSLSKKFERHSAYGGLLAENITQAVARDLLAAAIPNLESKGYPIVCHIHDEIICEVPHGFGSEQEMADIMCELPTWAKDLPISAGGWRGQRFRK